VRLPAAVEAAFRKAYPQARIKNIIHETEDGQEQYEIESVDHGLELDVNYKPDATELTPEGKWISPKPGKQRAARSAVVHDGRLRGAATQGAARRRTRSRGRLARAVDAPGPPKGGWLKRWPETRQTSSSRGCAKLNRPLPPPFDTIIALRNRREADDRGF
jgi:hypothetical protein